MFIEILEEKPKGKSPTSDTKSKFGFGLRKGVFSRSKKDDKEKSPTPVKEESPPKAGPGQSSPPSLQKKSFASRMASFSKRKKQTNNRNSASTGPGDDTTSTPVKIAPVKPTISGKKHRIRPCPTKNNCKIPKKITP